MDKVAIISETWGLNNYCTLPNEPADGAFLTKENGLKDLENPYFSVNKESNSLIKFWLLLKYISVL